jgi:predicted transcriptional regulator
VNAKNDPKKGKPKGKTMKPTTFRLDPDLQEILDDTVAATGASASYVLNAGLRRGLRPVVIEMTQRAATLRKKVQSGAEEPGE